MYRVKRFLIGLFGAAACLMAAIPVYAQQGQGQASITLTNCGAADCYTHDNKWEIAKTADGSGVVNGVGKVTWTITATKDSSSASEFSVHGGLTVTNTGSAPATIGNIVINLQKPRTGGNTGACKNIPWVSVAADVATATSDPDDNDDAANIVAAASQEVQACNASLQGASNYLVSGAQGTFKETPGSGFVEFTDASNNSLFSLVPQPVIAVGASITLLYHADFNIASTADPNPPAGAVLLAPGTSLRVEAIVSFGNSGARGGSGSSANNIDVNGDSVLDSVAGDDLLVDQLGADDGDEKNVRSVPCRTTMPALPATPTEANDSVTIADTVSTTGTVTSSNPVGFDQIPTTTSVGGSWEVSVDVDGGADGGQVCNEATLDGAAIEGTLNVIVGYTTGVVGIDPITGDPIEGQVPVYAKYSCATAADDSASACVEVGTTTDELLKDGDYCSYSQGGYQGGGVPGQFFVANFITAFPTGLTIGINDGAGPRHHALWNATELGRSQLQTFIGGGGPSVALTADVVDASSVSGGALAKQTAALSLNVGFSGISPIPAGFGGLVLTGTGGSLDGQTISQILAAANSALGGNGLPSGYSFGDLNTLIENLNLSFHNCLLSAWGASHLSKP